MNIHGTMGREKERGAFKDIVSSGSYAIISLCNYEISVSRQF